MQKYGRREAAAARRDKIHEERRGTLLKYSPKSSLARCPKQLIARRVIYTSSRTARRVYTAHAYGPYTKRISRDAVHEHFARIARDAVHAHAHRVLDMSWQAVGMHTAARALHAVRALWQLIAFDRSYGR